MEDGALPNSQPLEVAIAIIQREGQFLVSQRLPEDSFGGFWEFPGGKLNPGESLEAGLAREIREELGVQVEVGTKRIEIRHPYPSRTIHLHCFDCRLVAGEPQAIECASWRWVRAEELEGLVFPPASQPLIRLLRTAKSG